MIGINKRVQEIKKQQREALIFRLLSSLWTETQADNPILADLYINRVQLSSDGGHCTLLFYSPHGEAFFDEKLSTMKLFKPSMRTALAKEYQRRYVPDLVFKYDTTFAKQQELDLLIQQVAEEGQSSD